MKMIIAAVALVAATTMPASANMCVMQRDILSTHSDDGKNLTFKMRDGRTLVNHLQGICTDLRYEGFVWNVPGTEDICEYQQSFRTTGPRAVSTRTTCRPSECPPTRCTVTPGATSPSPE
jgi:hypothetical protein